MLFHNAPVALTNGDIGLRQVYGVFIKRIYVLQRNDERPVNTAEQVSRQSFLQLFHRKQYQPFSLGSNNTYIILERFRIYNIAQVDFYEPVVATYKKPGLLIHG